MKAADLVSKTLTTAPIFLAVPMADKPATPPPMTSTLAGGTRPAAVIWPVKKRPNWLAASTTALQQLICDVQCHSLRCLIYEECPNWLAASQLPRKTRTMSLNAKTLRDLLRQSPKLGGCLLNCSATFARRQSSWSEGKNARQSSTCDIC